MLSPEFCCCWGGVFLLICSQGWGCRAPSTKLPVLANCLKKKKQHFVFATHKCPFLFFLYFFRHKKPCRGLPAIPRPPPHPGLQCWLVVCRIYTPDWQQHNPGDCVAAFPCKNRQCSYLPCKSLGSMDRR